LLYGNMARDLYHLGKVLDKKYRYLTISYNLFMVGFIATVLSFLVLLFA
ncbi:MAG: phosphohydrolase, partial [Bacteroidetes bacterium]